MGRQQAVIASLSTVAVWLLVSVTSALAISAPIHIAGTDGEGVFIRPDPSTANPAVGWMPEGASPDYNCFVWGQNIGGVPIWFNVNYGGKTGYYASYYDDSSYHSNEELTAKYGVPLCGSSPAASSPPPVASSPPASPPASSPPASSAPAPAAIYFNPYGRNDRTGPHEVGDGATLDLPRGGSGDWYGGCKSSRRSYDAAITAAKGKPIITVSGWSAGRLGVLSFLSTASASQLRQLGYALLIDPGQYWDDPQHKQKEMECDPNYGGGRPFVRWLQANPTAHLVVISGSLSQSENSKGIQEIYFNDVRKLAPQVSPRILICNYPIDHQTAFSASKYWIQHQIGSTRNACPQLTVNGRPRPATAGWHPIN
jgi:uncharacterized protein YraI